MSGLKIFGGLLGACAAYLAVVIFFPVLEVKPQPFEKNPDAGMKQAPKCRRDIAYRVGGTTVRGWLYLPENMKGPVPLVILSQGFNGTKDAILENYALKFVENGYGALTYDYRHYGDSDGMPRQIYIGKEQLEDLEGAISFARHRSEIDSDRIILWGTSAAGHYGILAAAKDPGIACVIAQCSAYDHDEDEKTFKKRGDGIPFFLKLFVHAQRDKGRSRFGLSRHLIPAYGKPKTTAMFRGAGVFEGVGKLAGNSVNFRNEVCAGFLLMPQAGDPLKVAENINVPVLMQVCMHDEIISPRSHLKMAEILGELAEVKSYPIGHFDIYQGENFNIAVNDQLAFIERVFGR